LNHADLTMKKALPSFVAVCVCVAAALPFCSLVVAVSPIAVAAEPDADPARKQETAGSVPFDPVVQQIEGWTVHVDPQLLDGEHRDSGARALKMLANHLQRIAILVPDDRLAKMQKLEIWIEHQHPVLRGMHYHPDVGWLRSRGHDPRLAKKVHITRAAELLSRHQMIKHPAVILHELSHAYHDQYLGFDEPRIIEAYDKAMEKGIYEKVLLYTGEQVRHYAATNHKEYFAEGTEAYFYRNDFYPFVRAELKEHDPALHDLLAEIWGPLQ
jgi:dipeptidyl-peptidase-4